VRTRELRWRRLLAWVLPVVLLGLAASLGCASSSNSGFYHKVRPGENLYRIGLRYNIAPKVLVKANGVSDVRSVRTGTRLWIPRRGSAAPRKGTAARTARPTQASEARRLARLDARQSADLRFAWPLRGRLTSRFGKRSGRSHDGLDLAARKGSPIHAAEAGRVIKTGRLGDYGNVVILKHAGNYRSVYAHLSKSLVRRGSFVERGERIALVGNTGRSTGPHLHFEIRRRESPRDPLLYLP
jgi:murein DD-endopeptidase MepM/ murein hydrolase activator NlpD